MKVAKFTGEKWNAADRQARKQAAAQVKAEHANANSIPALRAVVSALARTVGVITQ